MGPHPAPKIVGLISAIVPTYPRSMRRILTVFMTIAVLAVAGTTASVSAKSNDIDKVVSLGVIKAPLLRPPSAGNYVNLIISLEITENTSRRSVTRHLLRLRDTVLRDLYANPIPPNRKDNVIDVAAIGDRLLDRVIRVVGGQKIARVHVYELKKDGMCDKGAPVGTWSKGCN